MMTRPLAGQRNFGSVPFPSAVLLVSVAAGVSATWVKTLALGGAASFCGAGAAPASATVGAALGLVADVRTPGMTSRSPTLSRALTGILSALASTLTGLP